jgi:hypothetical protein
MSEKKRKSLSERIEEASKRPLAYEGLTSSSDDAVWPSGDDSQDDDEQPTDGERFNSLLAAVAQRCKQED